MAPAGGQPAAAEEAVTVVSEGAACSMAAAVTKARTRTEMAAVEAVIGKTTRVRHRSAVHTIKVIPTSASRINLRRTMVDTVVPVVVVNSLATGAQAVAVLRRVGTATAATDN